MPTIFRFERLQPYWQITERAVLLVYRHAYCAGLANNTPFAQITKRKAREVQMIAKGAL